MPLCLIAVTIATFLRSPSIISARALPEGELLCELDTAANLCAGTQLHDYSLWIFLAPSSSNTMGHSALSTRDSEWSASNRGPCLATGTVVGFILGLGHALQRRAPHQVCGTCRPGVLASTLSFDRVYRL